MGGCLTRPETETRSSSSPSESNRKVSANAQLGPMTHLTMGREPKDDGLASSLLNVTEGHPDRILVCGEAYRGIQKSKTLRTFRTEGKASHYEKLMKRFAFSCVKGLKPDMPNQDDWCAVSDNDFTMIGVFDGHGET